MKARLPFIAAASLALQAFARDVTLKVAHFLPPAARD